MDPLGSAWSHRMNAPCDRCPRCGTERNAPAVEPGSVFKFKGSLIARYWCPDCGCRWLVGWDPESLEEAA
jgi:transposase-like protein